MKATITLEDTERGVIVNVNLTPNGVTDAEGQSLAAITMANIAVGLRSLYKIHAFNFINEQEVFE